MCHHKDYEHDKVFELLQSANRGDGICCKNDVKSGVCSKDYPDLHCSMPSYINEEEHNSHNHAPVFSLDDRNY